MFEAGDIVKAFSAQASKIKFHLCVCAAQDDKASVFLFLNSEHGFAGDITLLDGDIPGLPVSPTGNNVVSFSMLVRIGDRQLRLFLAEKTGELPTEIAERLIAHAERVPTLNRKDRQIVLDGLRSLI